MTNADMVIATFSYSGDILINDYWSTGLSTPLRDTTFGGTQGLLLSRGGHNDESNGNTWMEFIRPTFSADPYDKNLTTSVANVVVWAYGLSPTFEYHGQHRGFVFLDLFGVGSQPSGCPGSCTDHGECVDSICVCQHGWTGRDCSSSALPTTSFINPTHTPIPIPTPTSTSIPTPQLFPHFLHHTISLTPFLILRWSILLEQQAVALSLHRSDGRGWMGLSFGSADGMTNADMLIATLDGDSVLVGDYWSVSMSTPTKDTVFVGGKESIIYYRGTVLDEGMTVDVIRPLKGEDSYDKDITNGEVQVAYAFGYTDDLTKHTPSDRKALLVNFKTGAFTPTVSPYTSLKIAHGVIMYLTWGIILLGGALLARYYRKSGRVIRGLPAWFYIHRITQYTGVAGTIVGWIIALCMVMDHYSTVYHAQLATVLIGLTCLQVFFAFYRPHITTTITTTTTTTTTTAAETSKKAPLRAIFEFQHRWTGRLMILLSIPVIWSGLEELQSPLPLRITYIIAVLLLIIVVACFEIYEHLSFCTGLQMDNNYSQDEELTSLNVLQPSDEPPPPLPLHPSSPVKTVPLLSTTVVLPRGDDSLLDDESTEEKEVRLRRGRPRSSAGQGLDEVKV